MLAYVLNVLYFTSFHLILIKIWQLEFKWLFLKIKK